MHRIALIFFIVLLSWIVPYFIKKHNLKDNIRHEKTLPIGTAQFQGFMKFAKWLLFGFVVLGLVGWAMSLLGN